MDSLSSQQYSHLILYTIEIYICLIAHQNHNIECPELVILTILFGQGSNVKYKNSLGWK